MWGEADLILADEILSHKINLMRFTASERARVLKLLQKMQTSLRAKLLTDLTDFGKARVNKLLKETDEIINSAYVGIQQSFDFSELAQTEAGVTSKILTGIGLEAALPTATALKSIVSNLLIEGAPSAKWWKKQAESTAFNFAAQVRQGVVQGETLQQIITRVIGSPKKGIVGVMETSRRGASALVHTSISTIANDAAMTTFQANGDVIKGVQQLSTLDGHTSKICIAYSGAAWALDGRPINGTTLPFKGGPPRHWNCRSVLRPITKTYRELGLNINEVPTGTRASDLGQVKADITFNAFLKRHDKGYADDLLGPGRAEMWRKGRITLQDLVSGNGRELTLRQLKELH